MDNETIIKLVNAGYSKEEIAQMDAGAPAESAGDSAGEDVPKGNEDAGKEQGASAPEHESEIDKTIKALTDTVAGLSAAVKATTTSHGAVLLHLLITQLFMSKLSL